MKFVNNQEKLTLNELRKFLQERTKKKEAHLLLFDEQISSQRGKKNEHSKKSSGGSIRSSVNDSQEGTTVVNFSLDKYHKAKELVTLLQN